MEALLLEMFFPNFHWMWHKMRPTFLQSIHVRKTLTHLYTVVHTILPHLLFTWHCLVCLHDIDRHVRMTYYLVFRSGLLYICNSALLFYNKSGHLRGDVLRRFDIPYRGKPRVVIGRVGQSVIRPADGDWLDGAGQRYMSALWEHHR